MTISVCVPYWNRQKALDRMFEQYARLYPGLDIEFSVCDDGNENPPVIPEGAVLTTLPRKDRPLNACVPINAAVHASSGDIIVLTNPEIEHREPVLYSMLALAEHEDDYITARCWDVDLKIWLAGPDVDYTKHGRCPVPDGGHFHFLAMFTRSLWDTAGGFDEDYREWLGCDDNDWLFRAEQAGARFKTANATVYHYQRGGDIAPFQWNLPHGKALLYRKWTHLTPH